MLALVYKELIFINESNVSSFIVMKLFNFFLRFGSLIPRGNTCFLFEVGMEVKKKKKSLVVKGIG